MTARGILQADELQNRADALVARAENIDTLVDETQEDLAKKRKEFEHYKNRAQTEMAISLQARSAYWRAYAHMLAHIRAPRPFLRTRLGVRCP